MLNHPRVPLTIYPGAGGVVKGNRVLVSSRDLCVECGHPANFACDYRDRTGLRCSTTWCEAHIAKLGAHFYCRRHKPIKLALGVAEAPAVDDRVPSLVVNLLGEVEKTLRPELTRLRVTPLPLAEVESGGSTGWEAGWLVSSAGVAAGSKRTVAIYISSARPEHVELHIDGRVVPIGTPPWVNRRAGGDVRRDPELEGLFRERLAAAVTLALQIAIAYG